MLTIVVPETEMFDDSSQTFDVQPGFSLYLEHSLVSLSTWESKWEQPFLGPKPKTTEQTYDYVRAMTLNRGIDPAFSSRLTDEMIAEINAYIQAPMTATTFKEVQSSRGSSEVITSELIYFWMISMNIPFECQYWHLNRLMTLIKICNVKNTPKKKMSRSELVAQQRAVNAQRKAQLGTSG